MSVDLREEYDKILRFCFFRVHNNDIAEDLTQETFLRFLERPQYRSRGADLRLLYTIAGNLCTDYFRTRPTAELTDDIPDQKDQEEEVLTGVALSEAMSRLSPEDSELILLRYVNEVPVSVLSRLYGTSRPTMSRRIKGILKQLREEFDGKGESEDEQTIQKRYSGYIRKAAGKAKG